MDDVFRALADPVRRRLLDRLRRRDGQTLVELCRGLPMTRFGISKHLRVLEGAGLVTTRRQGREKLHFLNPVPLRLIHDRWTSQYAERFTRALGALKHRLEKPMADPKLRHVYEVYIRTTPEKLWQAITDPAFTRQYFYGCEMQSEWRKGATYASRFPDGRVAHQGKIVEIEPPRRLVQTFEAVFGDEFKKDRPSRITWLIERKGDVCKLTVVHDDFDGETATYKSVGPGWNPVLSGLKTLLETGEPLPLEMTSE